MCAVKPACPRNCRRRAQGLGNQSTEITVIWSVPVIGLMFDFA
jgi:hypothetical protein